MAKLKTKDAQELFILLQQAFFKHPENNSSFESAKGADGAAAVTMTVAANFDVSKVSSSLKKRLAGIIPENSERTTLCTVVLKAAREGEGIKVKTADTKFTLEPGKKCTRPRPKPWRPMLTLRLPSCPRRSSICACSSTARTCA